MTYRVQFAPEARDQLDALETYIAKAGEPEAAARYIDAIVTVCVALGSFPGRGVPRDDLLPGLRLTHYRKRAVIAYRVTGDIVSLIGVHYGGKDYDARFLEDPDEH